MKKVITLLLVGVLSLVVVVGGYYYWYVTNTDSPYDEIGIELNQMMPASIRNWGCGKLKENFADQLPPLGCSADDGSGGWGV